MEQVHTRFKVFGGTLAKDRSLGPVAHEIEKFVGDSKVAAKSIGVEFLEHAQRVIMTLGYRDDQPGRPIKLHCVRIGHFDPAGPVAHLEKEMGAAAARLQNVICHELYVTDQDEFFMVFMTQE